MAIENGMVSGLTGSSHSMFEDNSIQERHGYLVDDYFVPDKPDNGKTQWDELNNAIDKMSKTYAKEKATSVMVTTDVFKLLNQDGWQELLSLFLYTLKHDNRVSSENNVSELMELINAKRVDE